MRILAFFIIFIGISSNSFSKENSPNLQKCNPDFTVKDKKKCKYSLCGCEKEKNSCDKVLCPFPPDKKENQKHHGVPSFS